MAHPLSRTDVRLGLLAVVAAVVGIAGVAAVLMAEPGTSRSVGRGLAIALVAPVEPDIQPGGTMEVGALNDGFDRAGLERAAAFPTDDTLPPPAWVGDESLGDDPPRMPMPTPVKDTPMAEAPSSRVTPPVDPLADGSRLFGFDRPGPDYAAERARRWRSLDARTAQDPVEADASENLPTDQYSSE